MGPIGGLVVIRALSRCDGNCYWPAVREASRIFSPNSVARVRIRLFSPAAISLHSSSSPVKEISIISSRAPLIELQ